MCLNMQRMLFFLLLLVLGLLGGAHGKSRIDDAILQCLQHPNTFWAKDGDGRKRAPHNATLRYPDDAEAHYRTLLAATEELRNMTVPFHSYQGYSGPWIENYWIAHFSARPLSYFYPFVPLFVQWIDHHLHHGVNSERYVDMNLIIDVMHRHLRRDVVYLTVSEFDYGIMPLSLEYPNIFVLSAGGFGHVPIPLVKGGLTMALPASLEPKVAASFSADVGFFGNFAGAERPGRKKMLDMAREYCAKIGLTFRAIPPRTEDRGRCGDDSRWKAEMRSVKFNLAPRGMGRTSFRVSESIEVQSLPVYGYIRGVDFLPFEGTEMALPNYGFIVHIDAPDGHERHLYTVLDRIKAIVAEPSQATFQSLHANLSHARHFYTYAGVIQQIEWFIQDPLAGDHLRCTPRF